MQTDRRRYGSTRFNGHLLYLTPLKQRIFNLIRRTGADGIEGDELWRLAYYHDLPPYQGGHAGRNRLRQRTTLKANIWQLNKSLRPYKHQIVGSRCAGGWYVLKRTR